MLHSYIAEQADLSSFSGSRLVIRAHVHSVEVYSDDMTNRIASMEANVLAYYAKIKKIEATKGENVNLPNFEM